MLATNDQAPDFSLPDQTGKIINFKDFSGNWIVVYFYPKDMTPGCTTEACNFSATFPEFEKIDAVILGISKDSIERHKKFAEKYNLAFSLLSDENSDVCEQFGVWQKKKLYGREFLGIVRSTFLIDPTGKIAKVYPRVKVKEHHLEVLEDLKSLRR